MDLKVTRFTVEDGVGRVWLDRPDRGNSWTTRMNVEYRWIMSRLDADPAVRVMLVTGAGRHFCVGADIRALDHYAQSGEDYVASLRVEDLPRPGHGVRPEYDHDIVWHWGLKKPVIAAINGACAAMGLAIAAFCDLRYAVAGARLTTASAKVALPAEYGLSWLLPRIIGVTHSNDWLLSGRVVLAEEAQRVGFLNDVFPADVFEARVGELARTLAGTVSPRAAAITKRQIYADLMHGDVGASVEESKRLIGEMMRTDDFREGARALRDRTTPRFGALDDAGPVPAPRH